jgi:hypothetical protein
LGGTGGSCGGGGGGYAGAGGAGQYGSSAGEGTASAKVGDGGDAQIEFYCAQGSIPLNGVTLNAVGGAKGDGLTKKGSGTGGNGKGRTTSNGGTPKNIPRLIPITLGPADGTLYNNLDPTLTWMKCLDAVQFPDVGDPVAFYEVIIDNDTSFGHPADDAKEIDPGESSYVPSGLLGGKYYWEVRALYEGGKSPGWSQARNFLKNGPPNMIRNIPPISFPENTNLTHAVDLNNYFTDDLYPNDLSYSVSSEQDPTKVHAVMDGSWLDLYTMQDQWFGKKEFKVRARDKGGIWADSNNFTVSITPVNDPPYYHDVPDITVTEDQALVFDMSPYVGDPDTPVSQLRLGLMSTYATVQELNITLFYPRGIGTEHINLSLTDGQWTVWTLITVHINSVNDKPVTLPIPDLTTNENTNLTLDLTPFGMDEEDSPSELKWRAENVPTDLFTVNIDDHNVMTIVPVKYKYGDGKLLLVVRDTAGAEALANLTVKVVHVNQPPVIAGVPDLRVNVNVPYKLDVNPYVSDVDNDLKELRVTTNSLYATVSGFVITFQYPNDESLESETVRITVSDGKATGHEDIHVTLSFPPVFTEAIAPVSVEATKDVSVDLTRYVNDREDGPTGLKWSFSHLDKTLIQVSVDSNASMRVRSVGDKTGTTEFILTATDSDGNKVNATVQVTVMPKKSVFGGVGGGDVLLWALPVVLVAGIIGGSAGFYMMASRRKRRLEEEQARQDMQMLPTAEQKMVTLGAGPAAPESVPAGKVCFACGSALRVAGAGTFACTKCGRTQK